MKNINQYIAEHMFSGKKVTIKDQKNDYVDLSLPSGTLWSTCNIGANKPEEYGEYFAWGEASPKEEYTMDNYVFDKNSIDDGSDAAYKATNGRFKMPTYDDVDELIDYTTQNETTLNGINGMLFTSKKNNKTLFFPFSGNIRGDKLIGQKNIGSYLTKSPKKNGSTLVSCLYIGKAPEYDGVNIINNSKFAGRTIRGILVK